MFDPDRWRPPVVAALLLWVAFGGVAERGIYGLFGWHLDRAYAALVLPLGVIGLSFLWWACRRWLRERNDQ